MDNVYDIRRERQLQFICSAEHTGYVPTQGLLRSCVVVVNLYYAEQVGWYCRYLNKIPDGIDLYIFSSEEETLGQAGRYCKHKNTFYIKKENRGRDLSAFLVAFRPYMDRYSFICFLHDKKERAPWMKKDTDKWRENLWGNMAATGDYIYNILQLFEDHPKLGILFPPEPLGEGYLAWFQASWGDNFQNCRDLAEKLQLSADISRDKPVISHGSVFWTRWEALEKLLAFPWDYGDFPDEPMPPDFTVSHAVERIFGFAAQDAGYDAGTVMTEQYASWSLLFAQGYFKEMFSELSRRMGIENLLQFRALSMEKARILNYVRAHGSVYLYGAGKCGNMLVRMLREEGMEPDGFAVSDKEGSANLIEGLPVYGLGEIGEQKALEGANGRNIGIILTVYFPLQAEMIRNLEENGLHDFLVLFEE
ncbi:MAG TPA: hypothetical protein DF613_14760 [Lachnospiraceae bacterium]|nr:hypothetical protein [Lachnospiraceae bacterium]